MGEPVVQGYYHPTFLYEALWNVLAALFIIWADRRFRLGHGRVFALYVMSYCLGRGFIETLRIDEANHILGLRLNVWTSVLLFTGGLVYLLISSRLRPGRDSSLYWPGREPAVGGQDEPTATAPDPVPAVGESSGSGTKDVDENGKGAVPEAEAVAKKTGD